jgi:hypothetical protein
MARIKPAARRSPGARATKIAAPAAPAAPVPAAPSAPAPGRQHLRQRFRPGVAAQQQIRTYHRPGALVVRDLWAHATVATLTPPFAFTATVNGSGAAAAFRLSPA